MRKLQLVCLLWIAMLTLTMPTIAQEAAKGSRYDDQIQQDVEKLLRGRPQFNGLTAKTEDQIVTVEGSVKLYIDRLNAQRKIEKVKNVEAVRNHAQVMTSGSDDDLRQILSDKLRYDRVGFGIAFDAIALQVQKGVVTLSGNVQNYPSRDSAIAIVESTPGVKDVIDNLEISPTSAQDDELRLRLYRTTYGDSVLKKYAIDPQKPIRIVVENGHVTLYGTVDNDADKNVAEIRAKQVPGVFSVDNHLVAINQAKK